MPASRRGSTLEGIPIMQGQLKGQAAEVSITFSLQTDRMSKVCGKRAGGTLAEVAHKRNLIQGSTHGKDLCKLKVGVSVTELQFAPNRAKLVARLFGAQDLFA